MIQYIYEIHKSIKNYNYNHDLKQSQNYLIDLIGCFIKLLCIKTMIQNDK